MISPGRFKVTVGRYCKLVSVTPISLSVSGPMFDSVESSFYVVVVVVGLSSFFFFLPARR